MTFGHDDEDGYGEDYYDGDATLRMRVVMMTIKLTMWREECREFWGWPA